MKVFLKALLKSLFGDAANFSAVALGVLLAFALVASGEARAAGWALAVELVLATGWLAGRYGRPKG